MYCNILCTLSLLVLASAQLEEATALFEAIVTVEVPLLDLFLTFFFFFFVEPESFPLPALSVHRTRTNSKIGIISRIRIGSFLYLNIFRAVHLRHPH